MKWTKIINIFRKINPGSTIRLVCILERKNYQMNSSKYTTYKGIIQFVMSWLSKFEKSNTLMDIIMQHHNSNIEVLIISREKNVFI